MNEKYDTRNGPTSFIYVWGSSNYGMKETKTGQQTFGCTLHTQHLWFNSEDSYSESGSKC